MRMVLTTNGSGNDSQYSMTMRRNNSVIIIYPLPIDHAMRTVVYLICARETGKREKNPGQ